MSAPACRRQRWRRLALRAGARIEPRVLRAVIGRRVRQHEGAGETVRADALESACAVGQPDDHVIGVNKVCPHQIVIAVVVYVTGEDRAAGASERVEVKQRVSGGVAEAYIEALAGARATERRPIYAVITVKVGERERLLEAQERAFDQRFVADRMRHRAGATSPRHHKGEKDQRNVLQQDDALLHKAGI